MNKNEIIKVLSFVFSKESTYYMWLDEVFIAPMELSNILSVDKEYSVIVLIGGDENPDAVYSPAKWIKDNTNLKTCWYSESSLRVDFPKEYFNYVKVGAYNPDFGNLSIPTTNQRFYEIKNKEVKDLEGKVISSYNYLEDATFKFWKDYEIKRSADE